MLFSTKVRKSSSVTNPMTSVCWRTHSWAAVSISRRSSSSSKFAYLATSSVLMKSLVCATDVPTGGSACPAIGC